MTAYGIVLGSSPKFQDIPQFTRDSSYGVDVSWCYLKRHMEAEGNCIDYNPDFQRGHVWDLSKKIAYVEFSLRGGTSSRSIYFNCPHFARGRLENYVLVDGKQRLSAVLDFLNDLVPVFGNHVYSNFKDKLHMTGPCFRWNVNDLKTRVEVLQWYLDLNTGGVVHTSEEIERVKTLLAKEKE